MTEPGGPLAHGDLVQELEEIQAFLYVMRHDAEADEPMIFVSPQAEEVLGLDRHAFMHSREERALRIHPEDRDTWERHAQEAERTGHWDEEYRIIDAAGHVRSVHDRAHLIPAEGDRPPLWFGWVIDMTATREARAALIASEARHRLLVEHVPMLIYVDSDDTEPRSLYVSPNALEILGHRPEEYLADEHLWQASIHPEDLEDVKHAWVASISARTPFSCEYRMVRPHGQVVWIRDQAVPVWTDDHRVRFWQGVMEDVTARKEAEDERRASQERYRALVEQLPAVVYHYARSGASLYLSPNVEDLLGFPVSAFAEDHTLWHRLLHPDDVERMQEAWREADRTDSGYEVECRYLREDGSTIWVRDTARVVHGSDDEDPTWQGVLVDITAQRLAEEERRAVDRRYRALVEQVPAIVYEMDPDDERRTVFVSPQVEELLGYSRQEWLDQPDIWIELLHPEDRETELAAHDHHNQTGEPWHREYRLIASDGSEVWVRDQAKLALDPASGTATWHGILLDITGSKELEERLQLVNDELELRVLERTTELAEANELMGLEIGERRRVEADLREAEDRYRTLVEHLPGAVYEVEVNIEETSERDEHATITYISPRIATIVGFSAAEWGEPGFWKTRLHPHDRERVLAAAERTRSAGEPFAIEYRYLAKDGTVVWVLDQGTLRTRTLDGRPHLFQGVMLDVTARKEAERRAHEADERYRMLAEAGPFMPFAYDLDRETEPPALQVQHVSPRIAKVLGYPVDTWFDEPARWFDLMHPDDRERIAEARRRSWDTGEPLAEDYRMIAADGRVVWLRAGSRPVHFDDLGRPSAFMGSMMDITEMKEDERALREDATRLRELVEGVPALAWTTEHDPDAGTERFTYIGPQAFELLGYTAEELMEELDHFHRLVLPEDRAVVAMADAASAATGVWDAAYRVRRRDGAVVSLHAVGRRVTPAGVVPERWQGITIPVGEAGAPADRAEEGLSSEA